MSANWLEFVNVVSILQQSYIDDIVTIYGFCEYPIHRDVTMLASMCKLKVGRLSREVGFFSMMLMLKSLMLMFMKMVFVMLITMMLICTVYVDQGGTVTKRLLNDFPVPLEN